MKRILIYLGVFLLGALAAVGLILAFVPMPIDAMERGKAFTSGDPDWFLQNMSEVFPTRTVMRGVGSEALPVNAEALAGFSFDYEGKTKTLRDMFTDMETSGMIILHEGEIVFEDYARGAGSGTRMATYSLVKSFTSTLVGFAVGDGLIDNVEDQLTKYLPELEGTAYDGVTVKQALQMSSGVRFDPDIWDGKLDDTFTFISDSAVLGKKRAFKIAASYPRENEPGTKFNYNTAESQILLELVRRVTGKNAAAYMSEKLWQPIGMQHDAGWILDYPGVSGAEIGGAFFNASLRDWARFGQFIEQDGVWNGEQLLPAGWVDRATISDAPHLMHGEVHPSKRRGYAWHWWTYPDNTFTASGANGQTVYIDKANNIVVARSSAWPEGWVREYDDQSWAMFKALGTWAEAQSLQEASNQDSVAAAE